MMIFAESLLKLYQRHKIATEFTNGKILKFTQEENMGIQNEDIKGICSYCGLDYTGLKCTVCGEEYCYECAEELDFTCSECKNDIEFMK